MRKKLVAGNWKMHGSLGGNEALLRAVRSGVTGDGGQCAVCVPYPYLAQAQALLAGSQVAWGAQNLSEHARGAYTGEVAGSMLAEHGCRYVIVGHSERRALYGESDALVGAKLRAAHDCGLTPILCVGETLAERESGVTVQVVERQLQGALTEAGMAALSASVVAYEPVWAIGTGRTATPGTAQEVHAAIRGWLAARDAGFAARAQILYGGSVKAGNAKDLFAMADIDGALVGGASLDAGEFLAIWRAA